MPLRAFRKCFPTQVVSAPLPGLRAWLGQQFPPRSPARRPRFRPELLLLESRLVPSTFIEMDVDPFNNPNQGNNAPETANLVTVPVHDILTAGTDDWLTITGTIGIAQFNPFIPDTDFFKFTTSTKVGVFFDLDAIGAAGQSSSLDASLILFQETGFDPEEGAPITDVVGSNEDGFDFKGFNVLATGQPTSASLEPSLYRDLDPGTYYIQVARTGGLGDYRLHILADSNYASLVPEMSSIPPNGGNKNKTLFLDFGGYSSSTDRWVADHGNIPYTAAAFTLDSQSLEYSPGERLAMQNIWRQVAEDYSPFAVNVTTVAPASFADRSVFHQVITSSSASIIGGPDTYIGLAYGSSFTDTNPPQPPTPDTFNTNDNIAFTFANNVNTYSGDATHPGAGASGRIMGSAFEVGFTSSHEFGHALGLHHFTHAAQPIAIMQATDPGIVRGTWRTGTSTDGGGGQVVAPYTQDDMAVISQVIPYRADDHANTRETATVLTLANGSYSATGTIETLADQDWFQFTAPDGNTAIGVDVDGYVGNLDAQVRVYSSVPGSQYFSFSGPSSSFNASSTLNLAAGTYYVSVGSDGNSGEVGQYRLTVSPANWAPAITSGNLTRRLIPADQWGQNVIAKAQAGQPLTSAEQAYYNNQFPNEGDSVELSGSFGDFDLTEAHTVTINWGDGLGVNTTLNLAAGVTSFGPVTYTYVDDNPSGSSANVNTISVTTTDTHGASSTATMNVTVSNLSPTIALFAPAIATVGDVFTGAGSFTDPGSGITESFTGFVDYGDGFGFQPLDLSSDRTFTLNHTYTASNIYTVTVIVQDDDLGIGQRQFQVTANAPPVPDAGGPYIFRTGVDTSLTLDGSKSFDIDARFDAVWNTSFDGHLYNPNPSAYGDTQIEPGSHLLTALAITGDTVTGLRIEGGDLQADFRQSTPSGNWYFSEQGSNGYFNDLAISDFKSVGSIPVDSNGHFNPDAVRFHLTGIANLLSDFDDLDVRVNNSGAQGTVTATPATGGWNVTVSIPVDIRQTLHDSYDNEIYYNSGPATFDVGGTYVVSGFVSNPLTYAWDLNGDGNFTDATGMKPTLTAAQLTALNPTSTVTLRVTDSNGVARDDTVELAILGTNDRLIQGTTGNDTFSVTKPGANVLVNGVAQPGGTSRIILFGLGGDDTFTVAKEVSVPVELYGGEGADTYTVNFGTGLGTPVKVVDTGSVGSDHLTTNGTGSADYLEFNGTRVSWGNTPPSHTILKTVNYAGIENLTVAGGGGGDLIIDLGGNTEVLGEEGDDTIIVEGTIGHGLIVDGGEGSDTTIINLEGVTAPITVSDSGSTGTNRIEVNGTPLDDEFAITAGLLTGNGQTIAIDAGIQSLVVAAGAGNDSIVATDVGTTVESLTLIGGTGTETDEVAVSGEVPASVVILHVAPTVSVSGPSSLDEGDTFAGSGSFIDPDTSDTWTATVDYGDGSGAQSLELTADQFALSHVYHDNGTYSVTVQVTDSAGGVGSVVLAVQVDNLPPTVAITGAPDRVDEGTLVTLGAVVGDAGADTLSYFWTATVGETIWFTGTKSDFVFLPVDDGSWVVSLTVTDDDGASTTDTRTIAVTNVSPRDVSAGPDLAATEGDTVFLTGTFSDPGAADLLTYSWQAIAQDGVVVATGSTPVFDFMPDTHGTYTLVFTVSDGVGVTSDEAIVTVENAAPQVVLDGPFAESQEGTSLTFAVYSGIEGVIPLEGAPRPSVTGFVYDSDANATASYAWTVTRSSQVVASGTGESFSFTPADEGSYILTLTATDDAGASGSASTTLTVTNVAPTVDVGADVALDEGGSLTSVGSFVDPGSDAWTATVNYGDGSGSQALALNPDKTFTLGHVYANQGTFTVTVSIDDGDGGIQSDSAIETVANVAPTVNAGPDVALDEGGSLTGVGSFTDPGSDVWTATVDYGDGSGTHTLALNPDKTFALDHAFKDQGTFTVTVTIDDGDGGIRSDSVIVTVASVAPTASISGPLTGIRQQVLSFTLGATDPSPADSDSALGFRYHVVWGDGSAQDVTGHPGLILTHAYANAGQYGVSVTATDKDGATGGAAGQAVTIQPVLLDRGTLVVDGTAGNDTITLTPADLQGNLTLFINGTNLGAFHPTVQIIIYGHDGDDIIQLVSARINRKKVDVTVPAVLVGGNGNDRTDATGSSANNILIGGAGDDILVGGLGRDLLIGGVGRDQLYGNGAQDILIASRTSYDDNLRALNALMAEWGRTDVSDHVRTHHLQGTLGGGLNGGFFLNDATIIDDAAIDSLFGGSGRDLFFATTSGSNKDQIRK